MKKTKTMVRIISGVLVAIIVLGLIVPYVSATEVGETDTVVDATESNDVDVDAGVENDASALPPSGLPHGFQYVQDGDFWHVEKEEGNTAPAVIIDALPFEFDAEKVTIFIGNLETHEVVYYDLYKSLSYVSSIDLEDGYYVIFSNNFAWCDSKGNAYAINGGEYQYIYIGDSYNPDIYGIEFDRDVDFIRLNLGNTLEGMQKIPSNTNLLINESDLVYPENAKLEKLPDNDSNETEPDQTEPAGETDPDVGNEDKDNKKGILGLLVDALKRSAVLIFGAAACGIGLIIVKIKKREAIEKQTENDKYDADRIE